MLTVFVSFAFIMQQAQCISWYWQSSTTVSTSGLGFSPFDHEALFLSEMNVTSILSCTRRCHSQRQCRIFDYDSQSTRCRLFQGDAVTMGQLVFSTPSSRVGTIRITSDQFINIGQPCSMCVDNRYVICTNGTCQCPVNTMFDGSICRAQKVSGQSCQNGSECRSDLNYTCLYNLQCGGKCLTNNITDLCRR